MNLLRLLFLFFVGTIFILVFFVPFYLVSPNSYLSSIFLNNTSVAYQSVYSQARILSSNNVSVLQLTFVNSGDENVLIKNISVNGTTVFNHYIPLINFQNLTVYFKLKNIMNSNATVKFYVMTGNSSMTENTTAYVVKVAYSNLTNIIDVESYAISNTSMLYYYIVNFSPFPVYIEKIQYGNITLFNSTVELQPLTAKEFNFTLTNNINLYGNLTVEIKSYGGYEEQLNETVVY